MGNRGCGLERDRPHSPRISPPPNPKTRPVFTGVPVDESLRRTSHRIEFLLQRRPALGCAELRMDGNRGVWYGQVCS